MKSPFYVHIALRAMGAPRGLFLYERIATSPSGAREGQ